MDEIEQSMDTIKECSHNIALDINTQHCHVEVSYIMWYILCYNIIAIVSILGYDEFSAIVYLSML